MKRDRNNLKHLIHKMGFGEVEDYLLQYARPSIRVETSPVDDESVLAIGQSKIGGRPDLPKTVDWVKIPSHDGLVSLQFIAQFDLEDVKFYDEGNLLPDTGMLYFFGDPWRGSNYADNGQVIFYTGDKSVLERKPFPDDLLPTPPQESSQDRYEPCSVKFIPEINLDWDPVDEIEHYPDGKSWEDLANVVIAASYNRPSPPFSRDVNRLLGFPHDVPEDMQLDCQLIADTGSPYNSSSDEREAAEKKKADWQLLFQMSSDYNADMMWSDMGTICFHIRKQDLKAKNFDNVCLAFFTS